MSVQVLFWKGYYNLTRPFRKMYWRVVQPQTRGVKILVKNGEKFLLVRLAYAHKQWTLPGGGVDKGESFEDAAWRECKEETGIIPSSLIFIGEYSTRTEGKHDTVQCFFGESLNTETTIDPVEIADIGWFVPHEFPSARRDRVDKVMNLYHDWLTNQHGNA